MNKKNTFSGTINGRTYTDEKVFQYALREAIKKGGNLSVTCTSTDAAQPAPAKQEAQDDTFEIAISPDKIAANLECAADTDEFLANLREGLDAVISEFKDGISENRINCKLAVKKFDEEIERICNKSMAMSSHIEAASDKLRSRQEEVERLKREIEIGNAKIDALEMLCDSYTDMRNICDAEINPAPKTECRCNGLCASDAPTECRCDGLCASDAPTERTGGPATLDQLITQFLESFK